MPTGSVRLCRHITPSLTPNILAHATLSHADHNCCRLQDWKRASVTERFGGLTLGCSGSFESEDVARLCDAAMRGDVGRLSLFIRNGVNVEGRDAEGGR